MSMKWLVALPLLVLSIAGCNTVRNVLGVQSPGDPSIALRGTETRWLLVQNPRFGDVPSEPEYIWVEEDKRPWTVRWGVPQRAPIAAPEVVSQYGPPPGGGRVSVKQGTPFQVAPPPERPVAVSARPVSSAAGAVPASPTAATTKRGYVVWADTSRIVIDLTAQDGIRAGSVVSLRRDRIPIVHPVTGEVLGELDEEVATARVTELRDKFSVADIQTVAPGAQIQVRDRVVPK